MAGKKSRAAAKSASSPILIVIALVVVAGIALYFFDRLSQPESQTAEEEQLAAQQDGQPQTRGAIGQAFIQDATFIGERGNALLLSKDGTIFSVPHDFTTREAPAYTQLPGELGAEIAFSQIQPGSTVDVVVDVENSESVIKVIIVKALPKEQKAEEEQLPPVGK